MASSGFTSAQLAALSEMVSAAVASVVGASGGVGAGSVASAVDSGVVSEVVDAVGIGEAQTGVVGAGGGAGGSVAGVEAGDGNGAVSAGAVGGSGAGGVETESACGSDWSDASVALPEHKPVGALAKGISFRADAEETARAGFMGTYVRTPNVKTYRKFVKDHFGVSLPSGASVDLAMATYTFGTLPSAFEGGKQRLAGLMATGDAALGLALVESEVARGVAVSNVQDLKSRYLSNAFLSRVAVGVGIAKFVVFPNGVNAGTSKAGADAFEALGGVLYRHGGISAVLRLLVGAGIVEDRPSEGQRV